MWRDQIEALFSQLAADVIAWAPRLVALVVLVAVGLVVAWIGQRVVRTILGRLRFDKLVARAGVDDMLHRVGVRGSINDLMPRLAFYLLLVLFARSAADVLGLSAISDAIAGLMAYVPNLLGALLILMIGSALAQFAGRAVAAAADASGIQFANSLGSAVSALLLFVLVMMAVGQLQIETDMVRLVSGALLGGLALGFGLSFGLGSTDVTRGVLASFYARQQLRIGDRIEVGTAKGTLLGITPTHLLVDSGDAIVSVPTTVLLREGSRQPH